MGKVNLNLVLVLAVASVIAIPIVYGAIEPSIIINMDPSQTTKPLQIKDNLGTEVFSVDTDGTIFPATGGLGNSSLSSGVSFSNMYELSFEQVAQETQIFNASGRDNFLQLAKWRIDFNGIKNEKSPTSNPDVKNIGSILTSSLKSSDSTVRMELLVSFDDFVTVPETIMSLQNIGLIFNHDSEDSSGRICFGRSNFTDPCFIALAWGTTNVATGNGTFRDLRSDIIIIVPQGASVTQIIP